MRRLKVMRVMVRRKGTKMGRVPSPALITLGRQIRRYRDAAGLRQRELAELLGYSEPWLSALETGRLLPKADQVAVIEGALHIPAGVLMEVCKQLDIDPTPQWFREWRDVETTADVLRWVELSNIPGLLQTEDYAAVLLGKDQAAVAARMERQQILTRESPRPPTLHFVMDEAVLYRGVGGAKIMHDQVKQLVDSIGPRLTVQVVRSETNPQSAGAFILATADGRDVAYLETAVRGLVTTTGEDVSILSRAWESVRSYAMSQHESIEFIRRTAEERWV
ncbi:helix-turn-helix transcriptional regulator [Actinoallomurus purpureus]|uniref:helix-turn-helix domain-containing protein n=1 Tax=Actinoallomurus purpureus TaxID=478114 RepID=UPI002091F3D3|nr:helix-turn-helix transcriptional regulator [Actinoallomurus purpureus]MCO6005202.1 helix-turn-helix transcriptional regulator [Actinoallomurus purpureus]